LVRRLAPALSSRRDASRLPAYAASRRRAHVRVRRS
jgi:hypothetical protein